MNSKRCITTFVLLGILSCSGCIDNGEKTATEFENKIKETCTESIIENQAEIEELNSEYEQLKPKIKELISNYDILENTITNLTNYEQGVNAYNNEDYKKCVECMNKISNIPEGQSYATLAEILQSEYEMYSPDEINSIIELSEQQFEPAQELINKEPFKTLSNIFTDRKGIYVGPTFTRQDAYMKYEVVPYIYIDENNIISASFWSTMDKEVTPDLIKQNKTEFQTALTVNEDNAIGTVLSFNSSLEGFTTITFDFYFEENNLIIDSLLSTEEEGYYSLTPGKYTPI